MRVLSVTSTRITAGCEDRSAGVMSFRTWSSSLRGGNNFWRDTTSIEALSLGTLDSLLEYFISIVAWGYILPHGREDIARGMEGAMPLQQFEPNSPVSAKLSASFSAHRNFVR